MELKSKLSKNISEAVKNLVSNFNDEFDIRTGVDTEGPLKTPMSTDDEEVSSFNSLCDQVRSFCVQ